MLAEAARDLGLALRHPILADRRLAPIVRESSKLGARVVLLGELAH